MPCSYGGCEHNTPLTIRDWTGATNDAIHLLRQAKSARLVFLGARSYSEASRLAGRDELCQRIERARTILEDQADGMTYCPPWQPLRTWLGAIYDYEAIS